MGSDDGTATRARFGKFGKPIASRRRLEQIMCQRTSTSVMVQKSLYHERYWERSAWKTNRVDDHDVVAPSADMRAVLSLNSDW
jgi:hypothetical protein